MSIISVASIAVSVVKKDTLVSAELAGELEGK